MDNETTYDLKGLSVDISLKKFWSQNERFADLFNSILFGKEVVKPEKLKNIDTDVSMGILSKEFQRTLKRARDVVKISEDGTCYRIFGIENQQSIHYAMPLRCLVYDALTYLQRVEEITKSNKKEKNFDSPDEFLSGWKKEDRLMPCYTIVVYWGERPWDGPRKLSDMVHFEPGDPLQSCFRDYGMELICVNEPTEYQLKNEDVHKLFNAVKSLYANGGRNMSDILRDVSLDVAYVATIITKTTKEYGRIIESAWKEGKERIDMCEAVKKVLEEEKAVGAYSMLYELVEDNTLTFEQAARKKGLTVEEFTKKLKELGIVK